MIGLICANIFIPSTVAWSNGSYAYNATNYDSATDYGTHDWVADGALITLKNANASEWQWLYDRRNITFTGTEAPDNSGVSMVLDGTAVYGLGNTAQHHIYFNSDGSVSDNASADQAKTYGDMAKSAYDSGKLDLAAYYLGVMCHYIADMAVYCHVTPNTPVNFDEHHSDYENYVKTRTNSIKNRSEFFIANVISIGSKSPQSAAIDLAWDTFKDPNPSISTVRDALWMHNHFFSPWVNTYPQRAADTQTNQYYYSRIEESLNNAVKATVDAINYLIGKGFSYSSTPSTTTPDPTDTDGDSNYGDGDLLGIDGYPFLWIGILASFSIALIIRKRKL